VVQGISWQWIFWLNVPVGLVVAALSASRLRESRGPRPQLDIAGLVLAGAGLFALTWAAVRAPTVGWGSAEAIGALAAGVMLMLAFVWWERRARYPMLPLAYFRRRGFATANGVIFFQFISLIGSLFFITQLFQVGLGYSPLGAGLRILVWMAMPAAATPPRPRSSTGSGPPSGPPRRWPPSGCRSRPSPRLSPRRGSWPADRAEGQGEALGGADDNGDDALYLPHGLDDVLAGPAVFRLAR
jgi:hypothetical protein